MIRFCFFRNYIGLNFSNLVFIGDIYKFERFYSFRYVGLFMGMVRKEIV